MNRRGAPGHDPVLQRHHLIPRQALRHAGLERMFASLGKRRIGFDDFRRNGVLLPACDLTAVRTGLPLHPGPHRSYNDMVLDRLGTIEGNWSVCRSRRRTLADETAVMRIALLQQALRRRLLDERVPLILNRHQPLGAGQDFTLLDALAEELWTACAA
ncbi:AHH domain-containing protein [Qipengyuania algicida]|uniref:AHH domain-containing protein n=1 Tax=Qipengyuania algicida TaxID=1836209 RepID=UPI00301D5238